MTAAPVDEVDAGARRSPRYDPRAVESAGRDHARSRSNEQFVAHVTEVIFRSEDQRFAVLRVEREVDRREVVVVGAISSLDVGEVARFEGRSEQHASHGDRFRVESYVPHLPTTRRGVARLLGSGIVPGVGKDLANRIVAQFGEATIDVISRESARLRDVPGIGKRKAEAIASALRSRRHEAESLAFLHGLGLGPALARRVREKYGSDCVEVVKRDPYLAAEEVAGIGFRTADRIGRELGIANDDPRRAAAALLHALAQGTDDGHTFLPRAELAARVERLEVPWSVAEPTIPALVARDLVVVEGERLYPPPLHRAERLLAKGIRARLDAVFPHVTAGVTSDDTITLSERQVEAVTASFAGGVMILTGGPGTGKTTTVRTLVRAHRAAGKRVVLAAPTGRAAKRLADASGMEARTIHRLLEWNPATATFHRDAENPLEADTVVVDEASMLDLRLASSLEQAVPRGAHLVFVGDVDQLPPVGAGHVLRELIASACVPVVALDRVFRQAEESTIVEAAHQIREGEVPRSTPRGQRSAGDYFFIECRSSDETRAKLVDVLARIPASYGLRGREDVQVLTPMRRGPAGTEELNKLLADVLGQTARGPGRFRVGDKVMQTVNDYEREVWNGDIGWVARVEAGVVYVDFEGRARVSYPSDDIDGLTHAFAITIHKSQGSEFPAVVIVLDGSHHVMLHRSLFYTGVTRAKKLVVVLGHRRAIARAVANVDKQIVHGTLAARLARPRR